MRFISPMRSTDRNLATPSKPTSLRLTPTWRHSQGTRNRPKRWFCQRDARQHVVCSEHGAGWSMEFQSTGVAVFPSVFGQFIPWLNNVPTWKSALRALGAPVSKPARWRLCVETHTQLRERCFPLIPAFSPKGAKEKTRWGERPEAFPQCSPQRTARQEPRPTPPSVLPASCRKI